jgi:purine-binding chemotaxis protein CheW
MAELLCTAKVDDLLLGVPIDRVVEVLAHRSVTPVPLAHPAVLGLLNVRGQIMTVIDGRRLLARPPAESGISTILVIRAGDESVALVVDRAGDLVEVEDPHEERLLVLDPDEAFNLTTGEETMLACSADR